MLCCGLHGFQSRSLKESVKETLKQGSRFYMASCMLLHVCSELPWPITLFIHSPQMPMPWKAIFSFYFFWDTRVTSLSAQLGQMTHWHTCHCPQLSCVCAPGRTDNSWKLGTLWSGAKSHNRKTVNNQQSSEEETEKVPRGNSQYTGNI